MLADSQCCWLLFPPKIWLITPFRVATWDECYTTRPCFCPTSIEIAGCYLCETCLSFSSSKRTRSCRHSFSRETHGINPDGSIIKHNEAGHLGRREMQRRHKDLHGGERDRSIDYTPGKVRDPRSGWQAMCTDPSRSPKQYHATTCASMHASGARANRSANHPRNARFFVLTQMIASPSPPSKAFQTPGIFWPLSHFCPHSAAALKEGNAIAKFSF